MLRSSGPVTRVRGRLSRALWIGSVVAIVSSCPASVVASVVLRSFDWGQVAINRVMLALFALPFVLMIAGWRAGRGSKVADAATVRADRSLALDGEPRAPIAASAWKTGVVTNNGATVELEDQRGDRYTVMVGQANSDVWLTTLGLDVSARRYEARIQRAFSQLVFWLGGFPVLLTGAITAGMSLSDFMVSDGAGRTQGALVGAVFAALFSLWTSLHWIGVKVIVGADGVRFRDGVFSRFIPFDTVKNLRIAADSSVELELASGQTQRLWLDGDVGPSASVVARRIADAWRASQQPGKTVPSELLVRGQKSLAEWRSSLLALLAERASYRTVSVEVADLVRVLRDVSAPIEQRIAAAIALSAQESTREQVRVVIDSTANEQVRVALSTAVDGTLDEEQLERAVASTGVRVTV